jgi:DNA-directed RNA polymerase specialized sigma24 family protein
MHDDLTLLSWVPRLRRYAWALAGNRDDADDLVQDTLERAWSKSGLWREGGEVRDLRAWLFSVRHNLHVDRIRRPKLATVLMDEDTPDLAVAPTQAWSVVKPLLTRSKNVTLPEIAPRLLVQKRAMSRILRIHK